mgnify:CR=1 FL=1
MIRTLDIFRELSDKLDCDNEDYGFHELDSEYRKVRHGSFIVQPLSAILSSLCQNYHNELATLEGKIILYRGLNMLVDDFWTPIPMNELYGPDEWEYGPHNDEYRKVRESISDFVINLRSDIEENPRSEIFGFNPESEPVENT